MDKLHSTLIMINVGYVKKVCSESLGRVILAKDPLEIR